MKIENVRVEKVAGRPRLTATCLWEDVSRPTCEIYFETEPQYADALIPNGDAFVAAALTPALWAGEKRIRVDGTVCPELLENLEVAASVFRHWNNLPAGTAVIEGKGRAGPLARGATQAGFFFSGGIDSLSALRANRLHFPLDHPGSIRDGLIVFGLEVESDKAFSYVLESLADIAKDAAVNLVPVWTNVRVLNPDWNFWYQAYMGPALCAVAHAFSGRLSSAVIGSDYDVPHLKPHGSHPLVEPNFSSHELKIRYDGITRTRLEKTRLVAEWPTALRNLRVCNRPEHYESGRLNCGECEKCLRTMLALLALGALGKTKAFPRVDLSADAVRRQAALHPKILLYYEDLVGPLAARGRTDLADTLSALLVRARGETGWVGRLRRFDRERLNGGLGALKRAVRRPKPASPPTTGMIGFA